MAADASDRSETIGLHENPADVGMGRRGAVTVLRARKFLALAPRLAQVVAGCDEKHLFARAA
jgi:hypothetical protein